MFMKFGLSSDLIFILSIDDVQIIDVLHLGFLVIVHFVQWLASISLSTILLAIFESHAILIEYLQIFKFDQNDLLF